MKFNVLFVSLCALLMSISCTTKTAQQVNFELEGAWVEKTPQGVMHGFILDTLGKAASLNMANLEYTSWEQKNGNLILYGVTTGGSLDVEFADTMKIVRVRDGELVTKKGEFEHIYYDQDIRHFEGTLPCADCQGIRSRVALFNKPGSSEGLFILSNTYLGANDGKNETFITEGNWTTLKGTTKNPDAVVYQLYKGLDLEGVYELRNDQLIMLGEGGEPTPSEADYILKQVTFE